MLFRMTGHACHKFLKRLRLKAESSIKPSWWTRRVVAQRWELYEEQPFSFVVSQGHLAPSGWEKIVIEKILWIAVMLNIIPHIIKTIASGLTSLAFFLLRGSIMIKVKSINCQWLSNSRCPPTQNWGISPNFRWGVLAELLVQWRWRWVARLLIIILS